MRGITKLPLLLLMAIAAMAFAGPASASAADWVLPELEEKAQTSYSGPVEFFFPAISSAIVCNAEASAALQPGNSGSVDGFTLKSCSATGDYFEECEPPQSSSSNLPWALKVKDGAIDLETLKASFSFKECWEIKLVFKHVSLMPDDSNAISKLTVAGDEATVSVNGGQFTPLELNVNGTLNASEPDVFGIGVGDRWIVADPNPLEEPASVEVDGSLGWEWPFGNGIECSDVNGTATLLPGGAAEVGGLDVDPASCSGHGSALGGCEVKEANSGSEGTVEATDAGSVRFSELWLMMSGIKGCSEMWYAAAWGEVNAVPDNPSQISKLNINSPVSIETGLGLGSGEMTGSLNVLPAGKYGISG